MTRVLNPSFFNHPLTAHSFHSIWEFGFGMWDLVHGDLKFQISDFRSGISNFKFEISNSKMKRENQSCIRPLPSKHGRFPICLPIPAANRFQMRSTVFLLLHVPVQEGDRSFPRKLRMIGFIERAGVSEKTVIGALVPKYTYR